MALQRPTKQLIETYVREFWRRNTQPESAIRLLFEMFPDNKSYESVLLKSIVVNVLYATQIRAIKPVAQHILSLSIDNDLRNGVPDVVDRIARVTIGDKLRNNYSFATKYCSFHNPDAYPIYDSFVVRLLVAYQKQDEFTCFAANELKDYKRFKQVLAEYKDYYGLADINLRELDMFLWGYGKQLFG